jgi:diaminopimelate epimerase
MNTIKVTKMQGLGNDFVIVAPSEFDKTYMSMAELAIKLCDRNFGVGADGMIIPDLKAKNADIGWFFYNSDGTTAQMCGNGIRCFAKYAKDNNLVNSNKFSVETLAGIIVPEILEDGTVKVNMSKPILEPELIPFKITASDVTLNSIQGSKSEQLCDAETSSARRKEFNKLFNYPLTIDDKTFKINAVSMGNPHCIIFTDDDSDLLYLAKTYGPKIEKHPLFPEKTNVEFIKIKSRNEMDLRVFERGCGITLACGTGACASVVAAILNNLTDSKVKVNLLGGPLTIEWQGSLTNPNYDVYMTGPAEYSFFAEYIL